MFPMIVVSTVSMMAVLTTCDSATKGHNKKRTYAISRQVIHKSRKSAVEKKFSDGPWKGRTLSAD